MPRVRSNGLPTSDASGRTRYGLTNAMPRNVASAPPPTKLNEAFDENEPKSPATMSPTPMTPRTAPARVTLRDGPRLGGAAPSWGASAGGTPAARSGGRSHESAEPTRAAAGREDV